MPHKTTFRAGPSGLMLLDAAFEAGFGAVLAGGVAVGTLGGNDFPSVSDGGMVVAGCCLVLVAGVLAWAASADPVRAYSSALP